MGSAVEKRDGTCEGATFQHQPKEGEVVSSSGGRSTLVCCGREDQEVGRRGREIEASHQRTREMACNSGSHQPRQFALGGIRQEDPARTPSHQTVHRENYCQGRNRRSDNSSHSPRLAPHSETVGRTEDGRSLPPYRVEGGRRYNLRDVRRAIWLLTILAQQTQPASLTLRQLASLSGLPLVVCSRYIACLARYGLIGIRRRKGRKGCRIWLSHRGWLFLERLKKCSPDCPENVPLSPTPPFLNTAVSLQTLNNTVGVALATLPAQVKSKTRLILQEFKRLGGILRNRDDWGKAGRLFKNLINMFGFETAIEIVRIVIGAFGRCLATLVYALKYWALARLREWRGKGARKKRDEEPMPIYHRKWSEVKKEIFSDDDDEPILPPPIPSNPTPSDTIQLEEPENCIKCGRSIAEVPLDDSGVCIHCMGYNLKCANCGTTESKPFSEIQYRERFDAVLCRPCYIKRFNKLLEVTV